MDGELVFKIGGLTGEGVDSAGDILALAAARAGAEVHTYRTFSTVIKGGHTTYEVRTAPVPVRAPAEGVDCLVALDHFTLEQELPELRPGGTLVYDPAIAGQPDQLPPQARACPLPLMESARPFGGPIAKNMVGIGAAAFVAGIQPQHLEGAVRARFTGKRERLAQSSADAARAGWEGARATHAPMRRGVTPSASPSGRLLLSGNEAVGFAALMAGCRLFAGYPITPASDILEYLAAELPGLGGVALQMEDEIAALCLAVGAGHAGVRAMTATSGPGLALMTEAFGLAGTVDAPVVVVDCQRLGPSVGAPTRHAQQDLKQLALGTAGEFAHIVLTPGGTEDLFADIVAAFNLAEFYQCPVFVASDHMQALCKRTVRRFDLSAVTVERGDLVDGQAPGFDPSAYQRFRLTDSGIAPRAIPAEGQPTYMVSAGDHDEWGWHDDLGPNAPRIRQRQQERNCGKTSTLLDRLPGTRYHGPPQAEVLLLALGAPSGPILELLDTWTIERRSAAFLQLRCLWPFPVAEVAARVATARQVIVVEENVSGQLALLVRSATPEHHKLRSVRKYDGEPFRVGQLRAAVAVALGGHDNHRTNEGSARP